MIKFLALCGDNDLGTQTAYIGYESLNLLIEYYSQLTSCDIRVKEFWVYKIEKNKHDENSTIVYQFSNKENIEIVKTILRYRLLV